MNGLRYIRTQCNFSLSELADRLGVSRQIISAWETGKKEIPESRKIQLADFFGIDKMFFGDISEDQKKILLNKAMFRYIEEGNETYRYKPNINEKSQTAYFMPEREISLDEEFLELQKKQKKLIGRINNIISGPEQANLRDQMSYIVRGTEIFDKVANIMETCFSQKIHLKMYYYLASLEIIHTLLLVLDDDTCSEEYNVSDELVIAMKHVLDTKIESISKPNLNITHKKNTPVSIKEKIKKAEEEYQNFDKPQDMKMFAVNLDNI